ncbi:phage tail protein [Cohnella thailandensis]|uniref:Phage tail protein n=1 Tax=Cohnella thailandensis TaxID=557557 RepID=A0A841SVQ8_9BACL|nr:tail fiber protein [Cohnella thailandensis]MBB6634696.1 phage tail protein [Cohnella thailandensis]MBP1972748.1 microcystin-dependent protein [Cohnella thailandensis]
MDPYVGEIRIFAGTFAPRDWKLCDGSELYIRDFPELFSVIGTAYGGDGTFRFALPDLRGRAPMHFGEGQGLSNRPFAEAGGSAKVALIPEQMPPHVHTASCRTGTSLLKNPIGAVWSESTDGRKAPGIYSTKSDLRMSPEAIGAAGGSEPHNNRQPYLAIHYIIATTGELPRRPSDS